MAETKNINENNMPNSNSNIMKAVANSIFANLGESFPEVIVKSLNIFEQNISNENGKNNQ